MNLSTLEEQQTVLTERLAAPIASDPEPHGFRPDIEGLRAVAVVLVVAFHAGVGFISGGFIGVDIFFVMSGYLITGILARELTKTNTISLKEFYARRSRRLIPASVFLIVAVMLLCTFRFTFVDEKPVWKAAIGTVVYASNIVFMQAGINYFNSQTAATNPLLHTWSLAVEEQFYFVWPLLLVVGHRLSRRRSRLVTLLAAISLLSFACSLILQHKAQAYAFFLLPGRFWEFGVGGILAVIPAHRTRLTATQARLLGWLGLALIFLAAVVYTNATTFPGYAVLLPVAGSLLVLLAGANQAPWGIGRLLSLPPFQYIGRLSYSIYLWHWPILVLWAMGHPAWYRVVACLAATVLVAGFTHRFIENPIRFHPVLKRNPYLSIASMATLSFCSLLLAVGWWRIELKRSAHDKYMLASLDDNLRSMPSCIALPWESQVDGCFLGDTASKTTFVVFGDSHAWQWAPAFDVIGQQKGWRALILTRSSCPPEAVNTLWNDQMNHLYTECTTWRKRAIDRLDALHPIFVVLGSHSNYRSGPQRSQALSYDEWRQSYDTTLKHFSAEHIPVLVLADVPEFPESTPACLARAAKLGVECSPASSAVFNPVKDIAEVDATHDVPNATAVNLRSILCPNGVCQRESNGMILYSDSNHLTATFARYLAPELTKSLPVP